MKDETPTYNPKEIEPKWQKVWEQMPDLYRAIDGDVSRDKYYVLVEFPDPSGDGLHNGHVLSYTAQDIIARRLRMQGKNVLYPMGWDAFGLPTENYAIKHKIKPQDATAANVANFKRQMKALGLSFDWSREVNTTDPEYYKWTQWIFLQLLKKDLAYQDEVAINWCPHCKTGLANEEVVDGKHERCDTVVEKRMLKQWLLRITKYADRLIEDLGNVDYLDRVVSQQVNWIGKSQGAEIRFAVQGKEDVHIEVFTTRPDTLFGATFMVLAPEHPLLKSIVGADMTEAVARYQKQSQAKSNIERLEDREKTGVFTGVYLKNPATGEKIPVWVSDYVLMEYGTGAIMGVPAHDQRDFEFAKEYGLDIRQVVMPCADDTSNPPRAEFEEVVRDTVIVHLKDTSTGKFALLNWHESLEGITTAIMGGIEDGQTAEEAALAEIEEEAALTGVKIVRKLRWVTAAKYCASHKGQNRKAIAQVFYAEVDSLKGQGEIPESEQKIHTLVWVDEDKVLTSLTPDHQKSVWQQLQEETAITADGVLTNSGEYDGMESAEAKQKIVAWLEAKGLAKLKVRYKLRDWIFSRQHYWGEPIPVIHCHTCGAVPVPEDQLPVMLPDVEHYEPTDTGESPLATIEDWVNVECPTCGGSARRETDTMPNWAGSSWYYLRYIDPNNDQAFADPEKLKYWLPVDLYNGGMEHTTLHLLYSRFWHKFLFDQGLVPTSEPYAARRSHGMIHGPDGVKMSKSRGNVINPDDTIERFGADAVRLYEMFMGPYDQTKDWNEDKLAGVYRFVSRVWKLGLEAAHALGQDQSGGSGDGAFELTVDRQTHRAIKRVNDAIKNRSFNTMVSFLMEYVNFLTSADVHDKLMSAEHQELVRRSIGTLVLLIAPSVPHLAEELWQRLGQEESVHVQAWPKYDPEMIKEDVLTIVVQVNGKLRGEFLAAAGASNDELEAEARKVAHEKGWLAAEPKKVIVVPAKLVNIVL